MIKRAIRVEPAIPVRTTNERWRMSGEGEIEGRIRGINPSIVEPVVRSIGFSRFRRPHRIFCEANWQF